MSRPTLEALPDDLRTAAGWIGERLERAGHQAWIVGGAVRDLALGRIPADVDIATDARPERIEELFEHTTAVGKAFGTIIVHVPLSGRGTESSGIDVEVTTFRSDGAYVDARRPLEVTYSSSVEEDARRRDFTCNALYLGATGGEFLDPEQGLADLGAGRLRCVGDAAERFGEDGLRLLRLVRFEARFELVAAPETLAAARASRAALRGVSPERVQVELTGILTSRRPGAALRRLAQLGLLEAALPGWGDLALGRLGAELPARALDALAGELAGELDAKLPPELAFAVLYDPDPLWSLPPAERAAALAGSAAAFEGLRPSRSLRRGVQGCWRTRESLRDLLAEAAPTRAARLMLLRDGSWPLARRATLAWRAAAQLRLLDASGLARLAELERERGELPREELFPAPLLTAVDLAQSGIERGPRWGELLREVERRQLELEFSSRREALEWLAGQS